MIASATYNDPWAGKIAATLVPQRTTRNGERVTVYRWKDARGFVVDGMRAGHGAAYMIAAARHNARFSNVEQVVA